MKTTKTTTTVFELENGNLILGYRSDYDEYVVRFNGGDISSYNGDEMMEVYNLTPDQLNNMQETFKR